MRSAAAKVATIHWMTAHSCKRDTPKYGKTRENKTKREEEKNEDHRKRMEEDQKDDLHNGGAARLIDIANAHGVSQTTVQKIKKSGSFEEYKKINAKWHDEMKAKVEAYEQMKIGMAEAADGAGGNGNDGAAEVAANEENNAGENSVAAMLLLIVGRLDKIAGHLEMIRYNSNFRG